MSQQPTQSRHVLIVEDEPDFAALLRTILEKGGYTVATAHNCEDALRQVREHKPDLVTLDIHMPRRSGVFFYRELKAKQDYRDVPVVVVTGVTREDRVMENLVHSLLEPDNIPHPDAYVEKPVEGPRLLATLEEVLSGHPAGKPGTQSVQKEV